MIERLAKVLMCLTLGGFAMIVAVDNILNSGANYAFVQHVLSMDTIAGDTALRGRAVSDPMLWRIAYDAIIVGEAVTALLYVVAAGALWRHRRASPTRFARAKRWACAATTAGFLIWFGGFEIVGGEWFAMWQSAHWNGQQAAFRVYITMLAVLIFIMQPDAALEHEPPSAS